MFKPLELATPDPDIDYEEVLPLYASLGHAVARWGLLELALAEWFAALTGMSYQMANDMFFSQQSFKGRLAITEAARVNSSASEDDKLFIAAVQAKLRMYTEFRNSMVHGCAMSVCKPNGDFVESKLFAMYGPLSVEKIASGITIENLDQASRNFNALLGPMQESLLIRRGIVPRNTQGAVPTLKELRMRVEQLPSVASSHQASRKQRGRLRQEQAAARTPLPKRSSGKAP